MVGSAIVRVLKRCGHTNIIGRTLAELDLTDQAAVRAFLQSEEKPDQIYIAAAKVGGIHANNTYPGRVHPRQSDDRGQPHPRGVARWVSREILFLGSSCIYPKLAAQPMREDALLTGTLEPTNEPYAIAKIAGIKLCESYNRQYGASHGVDYRSVMPTNLYGPGDNYHPENSHVIPALIRRFHEAKLASAPRVTIWGTGTPRREFLYVDDMAEACVHVMNLDHATYAAHTQPMQSHINVGSGADVTIRESGRNHREGGGLSRQDRMRPKQAGWHAAQAARQQTAEYRLAGNRRSPLEQGLACTYAAFSQTWPRPPPWLCADGAITYSFRVSSTPAMSSTEQKVALITGITGQDGSYLAEFLLEKGYVVHGIKRRASLFNTDRVDHLYQDPHIDHRNFVLHYGDLADSTNLIRIVQQTQPDEIYNLGAQSHVAVSFESPEYTADVDGLGTLRLLEAIRILGLEKKTRFYQASTSELYGLVQETPQKETTPFLPAQPVCGGQALRLLDHGELPRSLRDVCLQRHPVQSRIEAARRNLRHPQDHPRPGQHRARAGRLPLHGQPRRATRLGPRQATMCACSG